VVVNQFSFWPRFYDEVVSDRPARQIRKTRAYTEEKAAAI